MRFFAAAFLTTIFFAGDFLAAGFFSLLFFAGTFFAAGLAVLVFPTTALLALFFFAVFLGLAAALAATGLAFAVAFLRAATVLAASAAFKLGVELGRGERAGGLAQPFDVVEGAALGQEDVDHEVHVVEQNPLAVAAALDGVGEDAETPS